MIRKKEEQTIGFRSIRGGNGEVESRNILNSVEEMYGKGRMFAEMILQPGVTIGEHAHSGDNEIFYVLSGVGTYNDNGTIVEIGPGDVAICNDGDTHSLANNGDEPLVLIALILY